jgi:ABC-type antimicrobial peptide transport system permease subunit
MFRNYFITAWRNLIRTKSYSIINISGLTIGMTVSLLAGLWVFDELYFNKCFKHYERLGQIYHHVDWGDEIMTLNDVPIPFGTELKNNYPDFESVATTSWPKEHLLAIGENKLSQTGMFVEPSFISMFSVDVVQGSGDALKDKRSIFVSRSFAKSLGEDVVGKQIDFDSHDQFLIAGIYEDFVAGSDFADVKFLAPFEHLTSALDTSRLARWENYNYQCFVLLRENASFAVAGNKIHDLLYRFTSADGKALKPKGFVFPMEKWHLHNQFDDGENTGGDIRYVWMFGLIGIFVLILACINFMTLTTARAETRSKEVGVRKVMGSLYKQLVIQFLSESFLIVLISYIIALLVATLLLPWFNTLSEKNISVAWTDPVFVLSSIGFILITSLLAGSYPALYLSSLQPVKVLKGTFKSGRFAALPRKILVMFQFSISFMLIIGTIVVFLQIEHAKNRPVGFDRQGIFHVAIRTEELANTNYNLFREQLLATGTVENMAISDAPTTGNMLGDASITWEGKDPNTKPLVAMNSCTHDFPRTNGFIFLAGRDFSRDVATDSSAVVINEMAAKLIAGNGDVIGKKITFGHGKEREIVGVIKDQIRWGPFQKQSPHVYFVDYTAKAFLTVRVKKGVPVREALSRVEEVIKTFDNKALFDYAFIDDDYAHMFQTEERIGKVASLLTVLALIISCIGMFGLAAFASGRRRKEIAIRKVLGASIFSVWKLLCKDFVQLVILAVVVGIPFAYYFADEWLQQYDYRVEISWSIFALTGLLAIGITLFTVSYQAITSAIMNPVNSLKVE